MSSLISHLRRGFAENVRFAMLAVRAHKLRAALTVLGIVVGVATVIAMVSIVTGFNNSMVRQFLLEAALLSAAGGVIGVIVGAGIAMAVRQVFPAQVKPSFIVLGVAVATVAGVMAGWIPSNQASKLPPVEALRYE